ncbi:MAG: Ig-like domain-containing protein [Thermonemataceae bacterium]|nr:Ig-like domain-containing protein [Thermonemataceae bacterium]
MKRFLQFFFLIAISLTSSLGFAAIPDLDEGNLSPANAATGVLTNATISFRFDVAVTKGSGNITLTPSPSGTAIVIPVGSASVSVSGVNVSITGLTMLANRTYTITIDAGTFTNAGDDYDGVITGGWSFTTLAPAPTLDARTPDHNTNNISTATNLVLDFDMPVAKGTGNIQIQAITPAGSTQTIAVGDANVTVASDIVTINNAAFTLNAATIYEVRVPNTAFVASGGATSPAFAGITATNWRFTTQGNAPTLTSSVPANNATNILTTSTLQLTFSMAVKKGTSGNITITPINPAGPAIVKDITLGDVTIASNVVTVASLGLVANTQYEVTIGTNTILANDPAQEPYAGLTSGNLRFVTTGNIAVTAPSLTDICRGGGYKVLGDIIINEVSIDNFKTGSGQLLILDMPANFELKPSVGTVSVTNADISIANYFINPTQIFIIYNVSGTANINQIQISGLEVKALSSATTGSMVRNAGSTAQMDGLSGIASFASLTSVAAPATPTLTVSPDPNFCVGESLATATINVTSPSTFTHKWYTDAALTTLVHTGNTANISTHLGVSSAVPATYTFYVVREDGSSTCVSAAQSVSINIYALPTISVVSNDADNQICEGQSIEVTFFGTSTSYTLELNGNPITAAQGTVATITGGVKFTSNTSLADGAYTLEAVGTLNGCNATETYNFTISPQPVVNYISPRTSFSISEPAYTLSGGTGIPLGGVGIYSGTGVNSSTGTFNPSVAGLGSHIITYTYTTTAGCSNTDTQTFTVTTGVSPIIGVDATECSGTTLIGPLTPNPSLYSGTVNPNNSIIPATSCFFPCVPGDTQYYITTKDRSLSSFVVYVTGNFYLDLNAINTYTGGAYPFSFELELGGCPVGCHTQLVTINKTPTFDDLRYNLGATFNQSFNLLVPYTAFCKEAGNLELKPFVTSPTGIGNYSYELRTTAPSTTPFTTIPSNIIDLGTLTAGNTYEIRATYTDANTCPATITRRFRVYPDATPIFTYNPISTFCEGSAFLSMNTSTTTDPTGTYDISRGQFSILDATATNIIYINTVGDNDFSANFLSAGNYVLRYTYTSAAGCRSSVDDTFTITPAPTPTFTFDAGTSQCADITTIAITTTPIIGATDRLWVRKLPSAFFVGQPLGQDFIDLSSQTPTARVGTYQVYYTYKDGNGCTAASSVQEFTVNPLPDLSFRFLDPSGFSVLPTPYTFCRYPGVTYKMQGFDGGVDQSLAGVFKISTSATGPFNTTPAISTQFFNPSLLSAGTYYIRFEYTNVSGCANVSAASQFTIYDLPTLDIIGLAAGYCESSASESVSGLVNGAAPTTPANGELVYRKQGASTWISNGAGVYTFNPSAMATSTGTGTYQMRFVYQDANSCRDSSSIRNFQIYPLPTPSFSGLSANYCVSDALVALTPLPAAGGTFRIRRVSPSATAFEILTGGNFNPAAPLPSEPLPGSPTLAQRNAKAGIYEITYTYTDANTCINTSSPIQVTVNPLPDVSFSFAGNDSDYCIDVSAVTLIPARANGGLTSANGFFRISRVSPAFVTDLAAGDNVLVPAMDLSGAGTYQVEYHYSDENSCENISPTQNLIIYPLPTPSVAGYSPSYCVNNADITLTPLPAAGGTFQIRRLSPSPTSYETLFGGVFKPSAPLPSQPLSSNPDITERNSKAGTYQVIYTYTDGNGCTNISIPISIVVNPLPVLSFTFPNGDDHTYCADEGVVVLTPNLASGLINPANGYFTIKKGTTFSLTLSNGDNDFSIATDLVANANGGTGDYDVYYTYTDANTCTYTSPVRVLTVNPLPILDFTFQDNDNTYCETTTSLTLTPTWTNSGGNPFVASAGFFRFTKGSFTYDAPNGINVVNPAINLVQSGGSYGVYQVSYHYTDLNGCSSISPSKELRIYPQAITDYIYTNACFGDATHFVAAITLPTFDANDAITEIKWEFGDGVTEVFSGATLSNGYSVFHQYSIPLTYQAKLTVSTLQGCQKSLIKNVRIGAIPVANFTTARFCQAEAVQFTSTSSIAPTDSIATVIWKFGDGVEETINIYASVPPASPNRQHLYTSPGEYEAELITISTLGCSDTIRKQVFIFPNITITENNPYRENFETSNGNWLPNGSVNGTPKMYSWTCAVPNGVKITSANSTRAWVTKLSDSTKYMDNEQSYVESPCFDIASLQRPMIRFKVFYDTDQGGDGAVLQVSKDDGVSWQVLGNVGEGVEWYNINGVAGLPGGQGLKGWSGRDMTDWVYAAFPLDAYIGETKLRFRFAFGSTADNVTPAPFDGFAFDDMFIGDRNRKVLLEHFTNAFDPTANSENDYIDNLVQSTNGEIVKIQYHTAFPTPDPIYEDNTSDPNARTFYYGVSEVPRTALDGSIDIQAQFSTWGLPIYNKRVLTPSPFSISVTYPTNPAELLNVSAEITALEDITDPINVQVVVVEKEISGSVFTDVNLGSLVFKNVEKRMLPDAAGTRVAQTWQNGTKVVVNQSWNPIDVYDKEKLGVVVFLQSETTKEVYQAFYSDVTTRPSGITALPAALVQNFILYPNPTKDKIVVGFENTNITEDFQILIYDPLGKICKEAQLQQGKQGVVIDVSSLSSGMYILKLQNKAGETLTRKFSVIR